MLLVIALGGNALIGKGEKGFADEQRKNLRRAIRQISKLVKDHKIVITHGNGPQVGNIYLQQEIAANTVPPMPLDVCGAMSQGMIGYFIQQELKSHLEKIGIEKEVATLLTQVLVDESDAAFQKPSKPIGPFYRENEAKKLQVERGWIMKFQTNKGWRRVVPSPTPKRIIEISSIKNLVNNGVIVVCTGGGGIPVIKRNNRLFGVEAVIDKDLASALLAIELNADRLIILTDVEGAALYYGSDKQTFLKRLRVSEARKFYNEGHFPPGSMGPKILACIEYVEKTKNPAIIAHLEKLEDSIKGRSGTWIVPD
ncbi:MAG: carbamate kinase [Thermoproteales archaeon]|nr:carbamate kinase [Thermoproteales archaeon]